MKYKVVHTDPTYLRTIHDGLLSGTVHKENASALPIGLVGMYEEALPPAANVNERKKFLEFFSIWALLKKEVSANFVLQFLFWWNEEEILEYISKYANWFNSPSNGKYILYHQRLRSFLLARMSDIGSKNDDFLVGLLALDGLSGSGEFKNYLEEFYGDHLMTSLQFKGTQENYYKLKTIDELIEQRQWEVKNSNRIRWNEMSVAIASYELDVPLLKNLYIVQDRILNRQIDLSFIFNQIFDGDFSDLEERLLFADSEVEKCYLLFYLIIELSERLIGKEDISTHQISLFNNLVERLNKVNCNGVWIAPLGILTFLNERILKLSLNENQVLTQIQILNFHDESWGDIPEWVYSSGNILIEELVLSLKECENYAVIDSVKLELEIKASIIKFIKIEMLPYYKGELNGLEHLISRIENYTFIEDGNGDVLLELLKLTGEHIGSTASSDLNFDFDDLVKSILFRVILRFPEFSSVSWIQAFVDSFFWVDTVRYFEIISVFLRDNKLNFFEISPQNWRSKENFRIAELAFLTIKVRNNKSDSEIQNFKLFLTRYLEYNSASVSEKWLDNIRVNDSGELKVVRNVLAQSEFELLMKQYKNYEFRHVPTLSNILSEKFDLLELISFLRDNITHYSDVARNKELITDLLKGLIVALGFSGTKEYIMGALEKYVPIMGGYGAYDYEFEYNRPSENTWSIEWWVIGDVVYEFTQIAESMEKELYLDYSNNFGDGDYETLLNEGFFYKEIETVFANNNFSPEDNLYRVIDDFMSIRPQKNYRNRLPDILFNYKVNPTRTLLRFGEISKDRQMLNCLARTISRE